MNKKLRIILVLLLFVVSLAGYNSFSASAQEINIEQEDTKTEEIIKEENTDTNKVDVKEKETGEVESKNSNQLKKANVITKANTSLISSETDIDAALSGATGDVVLAFECGKTIDLTKEIAINNNAITSLKLVSSDNQPVILRNANGKKHIVVTGDKAIKLNFENVELHGSTTLKKGGLSLESKAEGNEIDGLVVQDNHLIEWEDGVIKFANSNNSSLVIKNTKVINNSSIRGASSSAMMFLDAKNSDILLENVEFVSNNVENPSGGALGLYNEGGTVTLKNITFSKNIMSGAAAMNYDARNDSTLNIIGSKFIENENKNGTGAALRIRHRDASTTNISNTDFINNYAYRGHVALDLTEEGNSTTTLDNVKMNENKANQMEYDKENNNVTGDPSNGGAIGVEQFKANSKFIIKNSELNNNFAQTGGAINIYNDYSGYTNFIIQDSTLNNNKGDHIGGAIHYNLQSPNRIDHQYVIKNSQLKNNLITGKDFGPGFNKGGQGGAIEASILEDYPNALLLDKVSFENNKSQDPIIWSYNESQDAKISKIHKANVKDTTYSKATVSYIDGNYNNAYNGDDVYVGYDAFTYYNGNKDGAITDLDITNYPIDGSELSHKSYKGTGALTPINPDTTKYKFLGWYEEDGTKFDFSTGLQTDVYLTLYAKYEKIIKHNVTFDLNGASISDNSTINLSQAVVKNELASNPGSPVWHETANFDGWYLKDNKGNLSKKWDFDNDKVSEDITLFAKWSVNVDFEVVNNKDIKVPSSKVERNTVLHTIIEDLNTSENGKEFINIVWYTDKQLTNKADLNTAIDKHTTLYGKYTNKAVDPVKPDVKEPKKKVKNISKTGQENQLLLVTLFVMGSASLAYIYIRK
ncbi:MAG: InlB B-repeat-containing protein [Erysipelotrichales bacterium]